MKRKILFFCSIVIALCMIGFSVYLSAEEIEPSGEVGEVVEETPKEEIPKEEIPSETLETETQFNEFISGIFGTILSGLSGIVGASSIFGAVLVWLKKRANKLEINTEKLNIDSEKLKATITAFIEETTKWNAKLQEKITDLESKVVENQNSIIEEFKQFMSENQEHFDTFKNAINKNSDLIVATTLKDPKKVANGIATNVYEVNKKYEES